MSPTSRPTAWFVTGSSRGIGLELVRQLVASPENVVVAAVRNPGKATVLSGLKATAKGTLHVVDLDVSDFDSIRASAEALQHILGHVGLDYLINNAAIMYDDTPFTLDPDELMRVLRTNVAGPALLSQIALPFLEKGTRKTILNVSSVGGSIAHAQTLTGTRHRVGSYSVSKAALNMLTAGQKNERPDLITITMCPGWVQTETDMGGSDAPLQPRESVADVLKVITSVTAADSGKFVRQTGEEIPW
ncbi:NAD-P-binding protein [Trametes meyenii]|nr:NAD-P-binding protein [Trametes meyenii]